jgi:hypothetical protein
MANRYWVGGTATWDATALLKWSTTSGGVGGAAVPTTSDTVFFDANSGANTVTIGSGYNPSISTLTMTGFTGTLAFGSQNISVGGTGTVYTGATTFSVTGTPVINCTNSSATARTISPTATTEANAISFNVTAGNGSVALTAGSYLSLNFTGFTGTLANSSITIYGSIILNSGMIFTDGAGVKTFASTLVQQNITSNTVTFGGPITCSGTQTVQLQDALTLNSARTFTLTSGTLDLNSKTLTTGLFNSNNSNTRSILFGTGNISLTATNTTLMTAGTVTGFSYTGTPAINITGSGLSGETRFIIFGTVAGATESNTLNFNVTSGVDTISFTTNGSVKNLTFTGFTGTLNNTTRTIYGNLTLSSGMTLTAGALVATFASTSGTQQITTANQTLDFPLTFNGIGGTFAFQDALTQGSTRAFTITNGTVQLKASTTNTVGSFTTSGTNLKYLQSTTAGTKATINQTSGTIATNFLNVKDISAQGGAVWNTYTVNNNVNAGNNFGWNFGGNFMPMFS